MRNPITPFVDLKSQYAMLKDSIEDRIGSVLERGQYILGPEVEELEIALAKYCGADFAVGVSDGSKALLIALLALGVAPGDEVITSPFSFCAAAEMIALIGARPVFVDIGATDFNIDINLVDQAVTARTKAIIAVSLYGQCAALKALSEIASRYGLALIEDGAQSFGAEHFGVMSGNHGSIGTTSFFPSKPLGCYGDGGACFTNDEGLARTIRTIRDHGQVKRYLHQRIGVNGRLDTIQAAVLLAKLPYFDEEIKTRRAIADRYDQAFAMILDTPNVSTGNQHVYAQYTVRAPDRDMLCARLGERGVLTAIHYPTPLHLQPAFAYLGHTRGDFPVSELAAGEVFSLPIHPYMDESARDAIVEAVVTEAKRCGNGSK